MLCVILFLYISPSYATDDNHYRAAVLEIVQFSDLSYSASEVAERNLKTYETAGKTAASNGADIIVFPECGLFPPLKMNRSIILELSEEIPNPKLETSNPCNEKDVKNRPILTKLSCMAKENNIFVVANIFDRHNCEFTQFCDADSFESCNTNNECPPDDGNFYYNTNVVFNRNGVLIAKYHKIHLYFEKDMKTPDYPENVYFETDFGNFTTVICFDLAFKESVEAVNEPGVSNLVYPTYWFNNLPFVYFASAYQQAFAITNRVNVLAANVHDPRTGTLGSGIYSGDRGALIYTDNPDGRSKLLISNVPKTLDENSNEINSNAQRFIIQDNAVTEESLENPNPRADCNVKVLGPPSDKLTDYRCFIASENSYEFIKLEGNEGSLEACSSDFCCSLSYEALSMDEEYYFGRTVNPVIFDDTYEYGLEICFVARCETIDGVACANYKLQSNSVFKKIQIKGNFSTQYVYPFAMDSGVRLTNREKWSFNDNEILYHNVNSDSSVIFLGLYGRAYDKDKQHLH